MTQYPNDPGMDRQPPVPYQPHETYKVVTEEGFIAGMEEQTKYSYEATKQAAQNVLNKATEMHDATSKELESIATDIDDLSEDLIKLEENCENKFAAVEQVNQQQAEQIEALHQRNTLRMDSYDYAHLMNVIMNRC